MSHVITDPHLCVFQGEIRNIDGSDFNNPGWYLIGPNNSQGTENCIALDIRRKKKDQSRKKGCILRMCGGRKLSFNYEKNKYI